MCRYVEDCVLVLNAIYGPDKRDGTVADAAFKWNPDAPLRGLQDRLRAQRVRAAPADGRGAGAPARAPGGAASGSRRAWRAGGAGAAGGRGGAAAGGRGGGMSVEERRKIYQDVLERLSQARREARRRSTCPTCRSPSRSASSSKSSRPRRSTTSRDRATSTCCAPARQRSTWPNTFKSGRFVPAVEYLRAQRARTLLMRQMDEFMSKYDVLLSAGSDGTLGATNLTGHPAMALKCGIDNNDTPVHADGDRPALRRGDDVRGSRWRTSRRRTGKTNTPRWRRSTRV